MNRNPKIILIDGNSLAYRAFFAKGEGKPEKAVEKIVEGRLEKFYSEVCLLDQPFIKDTKITIKDYLGSLVAKIGENIVIRRFIRYQLGEKS